MISRTALAISFLAMALTIATGCGGAKSDSDTAADQKPNTSAMAQNLEGAPPWVMGSCEQFFGPDRRVVCGVGTVEGMNNFALARSAAQGRGRTEIAKKLEVRIKSVLTDYQSASASSSTDSTADAVTTTTPEEKDAQTESEVANTTTNTAISSQQIEESTRQITDMTLNGSHMAMSWVAPSGTFFALMSIEAAAFTETVKNAPNVPEPIKKIVIDNVPKLFSDYDD